MKEADTSVIPAKYGIQWCATGFRFEHGTAGLREGVCFMLTIVLAVGAARFYRAVSLLRAMSCIAFFSAIFFPFDGELIKALAMPIKKLPKISIEKMVDGFDVL